MTSTPEAPPPALLPYQQAWIADPAQLKIAEKGRRVGLTWGEAADDVLIASSEGGSKVFYISATQDMAREYIEACALWARAFNAAASELGEGAHKVHEWPSLHEVRSLAARLYRAEGVDVQTLLGHKHAEMTEIYEDDRGLSAHVWKRVAVPQTAP